MLQMLGQATWVLNSLLYLCCALLGPITLGFCVGEVTLDSSETSETGMFVVDPTINVILLIATPAFIVPFADFCLLLEAAAVCFEGPLSKTLSYAINAYLIFP